jgi:hypothetical protein
MIPADRNRVLVQLRLILAASIGWAWMLKTVLAP